MLGDEATIFIAMMPVHYKNSILEITTLRQEVPLHQRIVKMKMPLQRMNLIMMMLSRIVKMKMPLRRTNLLMMMLSRIVKMKMPLRTTNLMVMMLSRIARL